jgi:PPK2 family polyphosphate:nucleotide phosphotransferase
MMDVMKTSTYRVKPGVKVRLGRWKTDDDGGLDKKHAEKRFAELTQHIADLQERLYAESKRSVLVVLQAMDAAGKDSTINSVFAPLNPQGVRLFSFKAPNNHELAHDFLWRIHARVPPRGYMGLFNRSHYEDVLIVRVKNLVPEATWRKRYQHIVNFESLLHDEGTRVVKFYLHVSKDYQKDRLQRRLDRPDKHWKFDPGDIAERARWDDYMAAFEDAMGRTSTKDAPWYVVPSEKRWFRNLLIAQVVADVLGSMDIKLPEPTFDPKTIVIE